MNEEILQVVVTTAKESIEGSGVFPNVRLIVTGNSSTATRTIVLFDSSLPGGGLGAGVSVDPVAFLIVKDGSVRMLPVAEPASTTMDRIVEQAPDLMDKVADFLDSRKEKSEV